MRTKKHKLTPEMEAVKFKPGQSGNPNGRPPLTKEQKALRSLTLKSYREVIEMVLTGNLEELKEFAQHKDTPVIQVGVATALLKAIKNGDASVLEMFAARIIGKIPEVIHLDSHNVHTSEKEALATMSEAQLEERLKRIRARL